VASVQPGAKQQRAMLLILLAACERALEAFQVADNALDEDFVADLERITLRTRRELEAFASKAAEPT
jgi:hypothetical protein